MQILYGVDSDGDDNVVDRYVNATQVGTFVNNIVSVQIAVLVRSAREIKERTLNQSPTRSLMKPLQHPTTGFCGLFLQQQ